MDLFCAGEIKLSLEAQGKLMKQCGISSFKYDRNTAQKLQGFPCPSNQFPTSLNPLIKRESRRSLVCMCKDVTALQSVNAESECL